MTTVLGLDISLTATGIAFATGGAATIKYAPGETGDQRLVAIRNRVRLEAQWAGLAVIEDLPTHAHGAGLTGMAQGVCRVALRDLGVPYALVPPASLKRYACGRGNATKADMRMSLFVRTGMDIRDDNCVDAIWLRFAGMDRFGLAGIPQLPVLQRSALDVIRWPELVTP